jgi:putative membrane protein
MIKLMSILFAFFIAFFPARFGYDPDLLWVAILTSIGIWLSCFIPFVKSFGKKWIIWIIVLGFLAYLIEWIGVLTCVPYGCFTYSEQLWPKIFDIVPWMVFFSWSPLVIGVWHWIGVWTHQKPVRTMVKWLIGWILLVAFDLILDPVALMIGLRSYTADGFWFGVPRTNFAGRLLTGTMGVMIVDLIIWSKKVENAEKGERGIDMGMWLYLSFFLGYLFFSIMFLL